MAESDYPRWTVVQEGPGLANHTWHSVVCYRDEADIGIVRGRVFGRGLALAVADSLSDGRVDPSTGLPDPRAATGRCNECGGRICPIRCDAPYDQGEQRFCPSEEKMRPTCASNHCLSCGAET